MGFLKDIARVLTEALSLRLYTVTVIVELDGVLVGKKTAKQLMTMKKVERLLDGEI